MFEVPQSYLDRLAQIESNGNPMARNPNSSAKGLFQFIDSTAQQYGLQDPFDPVQATEAARRLTMDNYNALKSALGREPSEGELYLAHQQGAGGALKLLTNPQAMAADVVGAQAANLNAGEGMTAQDFANQWINKFQGAEIVPGQVEMAGQVPVSDVSMGMSLPEGFVLDEEVVTDLPEGFVLDETVAPVAEPVQNDPLAAAKQFNQENPIARTLGRTARTGTVGISSISDLGLLPLKTVALGSGLALEALGAEKVGSALQRIGMTPTMADTSRSLIDQATGGRLLPISGWDKAGDFLGEIVSGSAPFSSASKVVNSITSTPPTVGSAIRAVLDPQSAINQINPSSVQRMTADELRKASSNLYKQAADQGGIISSAKVDSFIDDMAKNVIPKDEKVLGLGAGKASKELLEEIKNIYGGKPLTLEEAQNFDEFLTEKIDDFVVNGVVNKEGNRIQKIQQAFRDTIENLSPDDVDNAKGFDALKKARELWARSRRLYDVERVLQRAEYMDQPANAVKTGLRTILTNPAKRRGYSKEEIKAMEKAMKTGLQDDILRTFGSRLMNYVGAGVGAAVGGPMGAAAGAAASTLGTGGARALGTSRQIEKTSALLDLIAGQATPKSVLRIPPRSALASISAANTSGQQMLPKPQLRLTAQ